MSDALTTFFEAWSISDAGARRAKIETSTAPDFIYADPRSGGPLVGLGPVAAYVSLFVDTAPGWGARITSVDVVDRHTRTIVAFTGPGPDGSDMTQYGTYFSQANEAGKLTMMTGFVGTGAPA